MKVTTLKCDCCGKPFSKTDGFGELKLSYKLNEIMEYIRIEDICRVCTEKLIKVINGQIKVK